jgi:nicotinate-nucleotide adenylyltransferase
MAFEDLEGSRRLAVMGGTFDPIHYAHLLIAEDVRRRFNLPLVLFMPSGDPPHKKDYQVSPAEDRYVMAVLATADNPHFRVSRLEIDGAGPSYTIDTIRTLNHRLDDLGQLYFVTGADAILDLPNWREPDAVLEESQVVGVTRPGFDLGRLEATLGPERAARVTVISAPAMDISSTQIRRRIAEGLSVRYLAPKSVIEYIEKRGLYSPPGQRSVGGSDRGATL